MSIASIRESMGDKFKEICIKTDFLKLKGILRQWERNHMRTLHHVDGQYVMRSHAIRKALGRHIKVFTKSYISINITPVGEKVRYFHTNKIFKSKLQVRFSNKQILLAATQSCQCDEISRGTRCRHIGLKKPPLLCVWICVICSYFRKI